MVNINERRLSAWRRGFITENVDLVGLEYLWKAVLLAPDSIVYKPIELLKDVYTNLSNKLQQDQVSLDAGPTCIHVYTLYRPSEVWNVHVSCSLCAVPLGLHPDMHAAVASGL